MPKPISLCLERLDPATKGRYFRCTARSGREAGLALSPSGRILWCSESPAAVALWVSGDEKLVAFRPSGTPTVRLERAERHLELPEERPVVLLQGDELALAEHRFRVHLHGATDVVEPPRLLRTARAAAAALAVGSASLGCSSNGVVQVPEPDDGRTRATPVLTNGVVVSDDFDPDAAGGSRGAGGAPPIEVRDNPPAVR
ncbi:MAG: hypothetical protein JW751_18730 [Polyangiaceae bacterium]|nr:hypothetical protein [Polyangiaceae bacterium]